MGLMQGLDTGIVGNAVGAVGNASEPVIRMVSNKELLENERKAAEERQDTAKIQGLAAYIKKQWESAKSAKDLIQEQLLRSQRQRNGDYDQDKLSLIREQGGTEVFMMLTSAKCRAAEAWIKDIIINGQDTPFDISPSAIPELSDDVSMQIQQQVYDEAQQQVEDIALIDGVVTEQEFFSIQNSLVERMSELSEFIIEEEKISAEKKANKMSVKITDQLQEGGFDEQMKMVVADIVTFKAGFIKGPIVRKRSKLKWKNTSEGYEPIESEELILEYERRSPFDIYPSSESSDINDGYLIDRQKLSVSDLNAMKGVDGYDSGAIDAVIDEYGRGGLKNWLTHDWERQVNEDKHYEYLNASGTIEALEYWGSVPGTVLLDHGFTEEEIDDKYNAYEVNAWLIGRWVIKATLNSRPLKDRPYCKASYENVPGSFWGRGVPELIEDVQQVCNATARSLVNNMAISAGTQVAINDINRIPKGEDIEAIYPGKIWQFSPDINSNGQKPIEFFQPAIISHRLLEVYSYFSNLADDYSGIPAFVQGNDDAKGAGKTASGLSMIMTHASRGIKDVISHIDSGIIEPIVRKTYVHNMRFDKDESIKGDVDIQAKGALSLFNKEQAQVRRNEFLMATNNPTDLSIVGEKGRAAILREIVKSLDLPTEDIVPTEEDIEQQAMQQQAMQQQAIKQQSMGIAGQTAGGKDTAVF